MCVFFCITQVPLEKGQVRCGCCGKRKQKDVCHRPFGRSQQEPCYAVKFERPLNITIEENVHRKLRVCDRCIRLVTRLDKCTDRLEKLKQEYFGNKEKYKNLQVQEAEENAKKNDENAMEKTGRVVIEDANSKERTQNVKEKSESADKESRLEEDLGREGNEFEGDKEGKTDQVDEGEVNDDGDTAGDNHNGAGTSNQVCCSFKQDTLQGFQTGYVHGLQTWYV